MKNEYNVSEPERKILEEKTRRRMKLRAEFLKMYTDPFRVAEGGAIFDPAIQRFMAMRVSTYEHFKPTRKTVAHGIAYIMPFFIFGYVLYTTREKQEKEYREGRVAYKDRLFKFK